MEATGHKTSGITMRDKLGYALGDMGGTLFLGMVGAFQQMFYTDVLRISPASIAVLLMVARIWDAVNDPMWGAMVDRRPAGKYGKFRPWLRVFAVPLAVSGALMFVYIPGLSPGGYLAFAYVTYIAYGMIYTGINIPFGSMASVITDDGMERSQLSVFRTIGAGIGGLPAQILLPFLVYSVSAAGVKYLDPNKLHISVLVLALCSVTIYSFAFRMTKERVLSQPKEAQGHNIVKTIGALLRNRPFLVLCFASMLLIGVTFYTQTVYNYLYKDYFVRPELYSAVTVATYAPTVLLLPVLHKLVLRFGKKRLCAWGLLLSAAANTLALLLRTTNPFVFMGFCFLSGLGGTFLNMQLWALITDVLDNQELLSRKREEGTCYALFFFTRKLGQTMAGSGSSFLFGAIGYDETKLVQSPGVANKMYTTATLAPAIAYALMALAMAFWYNLTPEKEEANREELRRHRAKIEAEALKED